jgi:hypothetical protein
MKKLIVLVAVMLIAGLLAGCWVLPESKLDYIEAIPNEVNLDAEITQKQLEVTAYYEDGTSTDVTSNCDYSSSNTEVVTVNDEGLIVAVDSGEAITLVSYTQHNFWTGRIIRTCEVEVTVEY